MARRNFEDIATISEEGALIVTNALETNRNLPVEFRASGSELYSGTLTGIHTVIEQAAAEEVMRQVEEAGGMDNFSMVNIQAMVAVEAFRQVSGLDLTAVLLRAHYLRTIQEQNLLANHPAGWSSLQEMAAQNGCSVTDMLATLDMVNVIFPWVQRELGIEVHELWATLGKSKLKEMLPVLKSLITGQESDTASVRNAVAALIEQEYASFRADPELASAFEVLDDDDASDADREAIEERLNGIARRNIAERLIELGGQLPIQELRRQMRPERTQPIPFYIVHNGENYILTSSATPDQINMLRNKMGERGEFLEVDLPADPRARQAEVFRNPFWRAVYDRVFGGQQ